MMKRQLSLLLAAALLLTLLPVTALAADTGDAAVLSAAVNDAAQPEESPIIEPQTEMAITQEELEDTLGSVMLLLGGSESAVPGEQSGVLRSTVGNYGDMTASEELIDFIKGQEGFMEKPYWDVSQWTVGYGTRCPDDKLEEYTENGIPEEEAEQLLADFVTSFSAAVNKMAAKYSVHLTQNQFDALVSFAYNVGTAWTVGGYRIFGATTNQLHAQDWTTTNTLTNPGWYFLNAIGSICHPVTYLHGLATRRILEMEIFTYGNYYNTYGALVQSGETCHYTYLYFDADGGTTKAPEDLEEWCSCHRHYFAGEPYGTLSNAEREGYTFAGWYTGKNGTGEKITASTLARVGSGRPGFTVYAKWIEGEDVEVDPEIGTAINGTGSGSVANNGGYIGFTDVQPDDWFAPYVEQAAGLGLVAGYTDGTFCPNDSITRAQALTMLHRLAGEPEPAATAAPVSFCDVKADSFYAPAVTWAASAQITNGYTDGTFRPQETITREQLATFLFRYAKLSGKDVSNTTQPVGYTDVGAVNTYAQEAMYWAINSGIITGTSSTTLLPQGTCTRAQAATVFVRYTDQ